MIEFLNEFKHLEKICGEIYNDRHGVTLYIDEMKEKTGAASRDIAGWNSDLEHLKRVRHIRNQLVHEPDTAAGYTWSDIDFMRDFYQRIMYQQDPLALLREKERRAAAARMPARPAGNAQQPSYGPAYGYYQQPNYNGQAYNGYQQNYNRPAYNNYQRPNYNGADNNKKGEKSGLIWLWIGIVIVAVVVAVIVLLKVMTG